MESKGSESNASDKSNPEVSLIFKRHWTQPQSTSTDPDLSSNNNNNSLFCSVCYIVHILRHNN